MSKDRLLKETEIKRQRTVKNAFEISLIGLILIAILSFFIYRNNRKIKESELKHQVSDMEMKSLRSQLNPHFIFNAMNTAKSIYEKNRSEGEGFLNEYSGFLRNILNSSEASEHSIDNEIKLIRAYFDIESARFEHLPTLEIIVKDNIDCYSVLIPSLLLQPLVENAIKYCLAVNDGNGSIHIIFLRNDNGLICRVEDRGEEDTYRPVSFNNKSAKEPHGILIARKRLELFNKKFKYKGGITSEPLHPGTAIVLNMAYSYVG